MADFFQSQFLSWNFGFVAAWGSWPVYNNAGKHLEVRINDSKKIGGTNNNNLTIREKFPAPIVSKSYTKSITSILYILGKLWTVARHGPRWRIWKTTMVSMEIFHLGVSKNRGKPQNGWFIMENAIKMDDLGATLFLETPICHWSFFLSEREIDCWSYEQRDEFGGI